ncbi:MAG: ABC transporter ATP-binding protein [Geminocystis sp.]
MIPLRQYRRLLGNYLQFNSLRFWGLGVTLLGSIALQILNPQILGTFIDTVSNNGTVDKLIPLAGLFIAIAVVKQVLSVFATYFGETVAWRATNSLRYDLMHHCLNLDLSFYKSYTPGELLERVDGDVDAISRFFSQLVIYVVGNGILLLGILGILFKENTLAGISLTLFSLFALVLLLRFHGWAIAPWGHYRQMSAEFFGFIGEHLEGREDIRGNGAFNYVMTRFYGLFQRWLPIYQTARLSSTFLWGGTVAVFTVGNAIALFISAYLWQKQAITIGTAYLIFHYTNLLRQPIEQIREQLEYLQQVEASIYRIQALFTITSQLPNSSRAYLPTTEPLSVSCEGVYFGYDTSEWTLENINFHLPAGSVLGVLGRTGSGKSTLARLLLRFYDPQKGSISFNHTPIAHVPLSQLRQRVGLVSQDVQLFQATVRDNLTFFDGTIEDETIWQILQLLDLEPWVRSLPRGLDTCLGADSQGLSAGEAQLLAFARIFLKNPGIVILDEASSRLDPITEKKIETAVDQLLHNRTGIIIAHRLQTVERADQILILERGNILEYGDRITLIQNPDSYYNKLLRMMREVNE